MKSVLDRVLLEFSDTDVWDLRSACEGTLITGAPGSGKSSTSGKNIAYALLKTPQMGGLVLTAKSEETTNWIAYAKDCGREKDLIVFNAESGHCFDPLFYEWHRPGRGAGDLETVIDLFSSLLSVGKKEVGQGHDPFWERGNQSLMRTNIKLLDLAQAPISIVNIDRVIKSLPTRPGEHEEEAWQRQSYCAELVNCVRERKDSLTSEQWSDLDMATQFIFRRWPAFDERPRSSLEMTWSGMADKFLYQPFNRLFCSGTCSFVPEMTTHAGKIVIVDFPMLEYGRETGQLINILVKLVFQRAWLRRKLSESGNPVFLWQDEFQYFVTRWDNLFQQTCRGSRAAVVCLTQNILNLAEELGEHAPGAKTKAFLGNLMLKIAHQQNDPDTQQYMSDLVGQAYTYMSSYNSDGRGGASAGGSMQRLPRIESVEFSRLAKPDGSNPCSAAIVYQGGKTFNATGTNTIEVLFSRECA